MKKLSILLLPALIASTLSGMTSSVAYAQTADKTSKNFVFNHVNVVDVKDGGVQTDMTVVLKDNTISEVGKSGEVTLPKDARVIDASGKYLIPGLWDMHTHIFYQKDIVFPMSLANGVTGLRDMGGYLENLTAWRKDAEDGKLMPEVISAGMMLESHVSAYGFRFLISNVQEGRHAVQTLKKRGADFVKVYENLTREEYFAIADEAKKMDLSFAGHVPYSVSYEEASNSGQRTLEHLYGFFLNTSYKSKSYLEAFGLKRDEDVAFEAAMLNAQAVTEYSEAEAKRLFDIFAKNQTYVVPTFNTHQVLMGLGHKDFSKDPRNKYVAPEIVQGWNDFAPVYAGLAEGKLQGYISTWTNKNYSIITDMYNAGVPILAGTDVAMPDVPYVYAGFSLHDELGELVKAGLTPLQSLQTATLNPAKYLGREKQAGTVEEGKEADLVLLTANPLEDIANTKKIDSVVVDGKLLEKPMLDDMLNKLIGSKKYEPESVHVRAIEQAGGKVDWNGETREVTIKKADETLKIKIDSNIVSFNGDKMVLGKKAEIVDGKTMVSKDMLEGLFYVEIN